VSSFRERERVFNLILKVLKSLKDFPVPTKTHNVQSFLGLCSYFRRFVKDFSTKARPLYDLARKNRKFELGVKES